MNDDELTTAVKDSVTGVRMEIPAERIISRGRGIRSRRLIPGVAAGLAIVAGAALSVTTLLPAGHQPGRPAGAQLAAWTVTRQSGGSIRVTIRQLRDPAGLQSALRADGVPVSVTFAGRPNPACQGYPGGGDQAQRRQLLSGAATGTARRPNILVIHPAGIPSGAGLGIAAQFRQDHGPHRLLGFSVRMVQASPGCTGS